MRVVPKKEYRPPKLHVYGDLSQITKAHPPPGAKNALIDHRHFQTRDPSVSCIWLRSAIPIGDSRPDAAAR